MPKKITTHDNLVISAIAQRAQRMYDDQGVHRDRLDWIMDIECVHRNVGLRLDELYAADDFNFSHDVGGIARHLNRESETLENCFRPRFAA